MPPAAKPLDTPIRAMPPYLEPGASTTSGCSDDQLHLAKVMGVLRVVLQHLPCTISTPKDVYNLAAVGKSAKQMLQAQPVPLIDINACDLHITKLSNMLRWLSNYPGLVRSMSVHQSNECTSLGCEDTATYAAVAEQMLLAVLEKTTLVSRPPLHLQRFSTNVLRTPAVLAAMAGAGVNELVLFGLPARRHSIQKPFPRHHVLESALPASLAGMTTLRTLRLRANSSNVLLSGVVDHEFTMPYACALKGLIALETLELAAAALPALAVAHLPPSLKHLQMTIGTPEQMDLSHLTSLQHLDLGVSCELLEGCALPPHLTRLRLWAHNSNVGHLDLSVLLGLRQLVVLEVTNAAELLLHCCASLTNLVSIKLLGSSPGSIALLAPIWRHMPKLLHAEVEFQGSAQGVDLSGIFEGIGTANALKSLDIDVTGSALRASVGPADLCKHLTDLTELTRLAVMGVPCMSMYDPLHLTVLTKLRRLDLSGCGIAVDDTVATAIGCRLSGLCDLALVGCGLSSISVLPALAVLSGLTYLGLTHNGRFCCTDTGLMMLSTLTNLRELEVDRHEITDEGLQRFKAAIPQVACYLYTSAYQ